MDELARKVAAPKRGEEEVAIFRKFYKHAAEKDAHLSEQERSLFIANLHDKDQVLDTWSRMLQDQASDPWWMDPLYHPRFHGTLITSPAQTSGCLSQRRLCRIL